MTEEEVLKEVISSLNDLNISYALTGGLAVSFYGHPRSTHDFDLILKVVPDSKLTKKLLEVFGKDFYISEEGIIDALLHKTMFNLIHHETGLKLDLWVLKDDQYDREAFTRRRKVRALDTEIYVLSVEDMILGKLLWYKVSEIEKHFNDVKSIYEVQKNNIDNRYLSKWALNLSVNELLNKVIG